MNLRLDFTLLTHSGNVLSSTEKEKKKMFLTFLCVRLILHKLKWKKYMEVFDFLFWKLHFRWFRQCLFSVQNKFNINIFLNMFSCWISHLESQKLPTKIDFYFESFIIIDFHSSWHFELEILFESFFCFSFFFDLFK